VESKARQYIDSSDGKIRAVLLLNFQYPGMKKAWVSLLVADGWIQRHEVYHDDNLDAQPVGRVGLYLSDFIDAAGLPPAYCRPTAAELTDGTMRFAVLQLSETT
jgi:hypothetical protein